MTKKDELGGEKIAPVKADDQKTATVPDSKNFNASVENLRTALANLGLKIIDDINSKRVHKPEEVYNALVSIYNAIK